MSGVINKDLIMRYISLTIIFFALALVSSSCKVSYSFSGSDTGNLSTVSVQYFQDRSSLAPVSLPQRFTDELRDFIQRQTKLKLINDIADRLKSGEHCMDNINKVEMKLDREILELVYNGQKDLLKSIEETIKKICNLEEPK